jgi:Family of unknown function (DUF5343)
MAFHPYISGAGNITQMISFLRKSFPATVNSDTVKKLGLAPNNESYVINALQFLGIIDEEGKRTPPGQEVFAKHDDDEFKKAFEGLVRDAYKDLFELKKEDAWIMNKNALISYFRSADKTSDVIGTRQAAVFHALRVIAGHESSHPAAQKAGGASKPAARLPKQKTTKAEGAKKKPEPPDPALVDKAPKRDMALTVRVEINLPADASAETYDNIFKSIRANLLDDPTG